MKLQTNCFRNLFLSLLIFQGTNSGAQGNYLYEHIVCFKNGTFIYKQNDKYGFKTFEKRLTEPVYDTIFQFGPRYCVVKQNNEYFVLGEELEKRFSQPIISAERTFQYDKRNVTLTLIFDKNEEFQYTVDIYNGDPRFRYDIRNPFQFYAREYSPTYSPPKKFDPDDYVRPTDYNLKDRWVDSIQYRKEQCIYYFKNRDYRIRNLSENEDYIGMYYIRFDSDEFSGVIDLESGDTVLKLPNNLSIKLDYYRNKPFFEVGNYLSDTMKWYAYDTTGNLMTELAAENTVWYKNGRIYEEIHPKDKRYPGYSYKHYNLYRFRDGKPLLKNVIDFDEQENFQVVRAQNEPIFYLLYNDTIIGFVRNKKTGPYLTVGNGDNQPENQLVSLRTNEDDDSKCITYFFSTKTGFYKQFKGAYFLDYDKIYRNYKVYHEENDRKHPENDSYWKGIYYEPWDSIVFAKHGEFSHQIGNNTFLSKLTDTTYNIIALNGKRISDVIVEDYQTVEVEDRQYQVLKVNGKARLYSEQFVQICEDCELTQLVSQTIYPFKSLLLFKKKDDPGYQLVDKNLEPVFDQYFKSVYVINNVLVVLNPDDSIQYLSPEAIGKLTD